MSVRKRTWVTAKGVEKEAWIADYVDQKSKRRLKTFKRKKDAEAFAATASVEVREGTHVADSASVTVKKAGDAWIEAGKANLKHATLLQYRQLLDLHIEPFIGRQRLSQLSAPEVRRFEDQLREHGRSPSMIRKVVGGLGAILADAGERGWINRNVVRDLRGRRRKGKARKAEKRQKGKLKVGVDIPTRQEIKAIVDHATGRWRPLLITAIFTGLRASELRGLPWKNVDFDAREIHVRQRADRYNDIGDPKSEDGWRTVPLPPLVVNTLREWKLACPKGDLVFPNGQGNVENLGNIRQRGLIPTMIAAGVTVSSGKVDKDGDTGPKAKYTGMHALRHFYASWCINSKADGGLGLASKVVQERMGHSTINMTMDVYGHLFPRGDDAEELASAEATLLA